MHGDECVYRRAWTLITFSMNLYLFVVVYTSNGLLVKADPFIESIHYIPNNTPFHISVKMINKNLF